MSTGAYLPAPDLTQGNTLSFERPDGSLYLLWVSPPPVVDAILDLADLELGDVLYDLGSGDGRVVIRAAQEHGVRATGIEANLDLYEHSCRRVLGLGLQELVTVKHGDFNGEDITPADVLVLFLGPEDLRLPLKRKVRGRLLAGARLVTVDCPFDEAVETRRMTVRFGPSQYTLRLYRGPTAAVRRC